uniref:RIIa domain-containing protein n=1 Tax=Ciona savignyi TaxID=51511 RepID=H2YER9_CIOSA
MANEQTKVETNRDVPVAQERRKKRRRRRSRASVDYEEMSVRYGAVKLQVPSGFKQLLENLSREILREQPKNIPNFAAAYFNRLLERREQGFADGNLVSERIVELEDAAPLAAVEEVMSPVNVGAEEVAPTIQTAAEEEEEMPDLTDPEVEKAATLIQASFRGFASRKSVASEKQPNTKQMKILHKLADEPQTSQQADSTSAGTTSFAKDALVDALFEAGEEENLKKIHSP